MSLCRLMDASQELAAVNPALSAWLAKAAERIRHGLNPAMALELAGPGARRERDRYLTQAATIMQRENESLWALAGRMAVRIGQRRHHDSIQALLELAAKAAPLPTSQRRIYGTLLRNLAPTDEHRQALSGQRFEHEPTDHPWVKKSCLNPPLSRPRPICQPSNTSTNLADY